MKYVKISKHDVQQLLILINSAKDRKTGEGFLQGLMDPRSGNRRVDAILRSVLKIGETVLIKELIRRLFD